MFEALLFNGTDEKALIPGYTNYILMTARANRLGGSIFSVDGVAHLYGGGDATYNYQNDLFTFTRAAGMTTVTNFGLDWPAVRFGNVIAQEKLVYMFGINNSNQFCVRIMNFNTRTSETISSTVVPGITPIAKLGLDYNPTLGAFFMKWLGSNVVMRYTVATKAWAQIPVTTPPASFTTNEFLICGVENLFFMAGTGGNLNVNKLAYAGGVPAQHGVLPDASFTSQYQGCVVDKGIAYYPTWTGTRFLFNMFKPEELKALNSPLPVPVPFRNVMSIGRALTGIVWAGGVPTPVGQGQWQQDTRYADMFEIPVDFEANS